MSVRVYGCMTGEPEDKHFIDIKNITVCQSIHES
jgi:hypothetical protein